MYLQEPEFLEQNTKHTDPTSNISDLYLGGAQFNLGRVTGHPDTSSVSQGSDGIVPIIRLFPSISFLIH
jgi:hypothetical protein